MKKRSLILFCILLLLNACEENTYTPEFLEDNKIRMEVGKEIVFTYDPVACQYSYNLERCEFRAHTDNMSEFFHIRLESLPKTEGEEIIASEMEWTQKNWINQSRKNIVLQVVKLQDNKVWLWNSKESSKMIVQFQ